MDPEIVAPATPTDPAAPPAPSEPPVEQSIAEHEAQFGQNRPTEEEPPAERPRHRAKSQQARAEDVPRIAELTKKLREAERERDEWKSKHATPAPVAPVARETAPAPQQPPKPPASDKPSWKTFEAEIGSKYDTWADAQDAFADARDDWKEVDAKRTAERQQQTQTEAAAIERDRQSVVNHRQRMDAFAAKTPDFVTVTDAVMHQNMPMALVKAIATHDNGPEFVYYLAQHPDALDDLAIVAHGRDPNDDDLVALLQRRLSHYRTAAVPAASAPPVPARLAPRPPNAARTGSLKTSDEPPGDDASIADHERYYGRRKRG